VGLFAGAPPRELGNGQQQRQLSGQLWGIGSVRDLIPPRGVTSTRRPFVSADTALQHSAVWACLRLRADLVSTLPLGVWRYGPDGQLRITVPTPTVLLQPGGPKCRRPEWMFSSQFDLDRVGNVIGLISERDGNGFPARIDLQRTADCTILLKGNQITGYRVGPALYRPEDVWHEKQYTVPGIPIGLSPVAYAALTIGKYLSIEEFALTWFAGGGVPRARLRNTQKKIVGKEATIVKEAWNAAISAGEPFVHGMDWEYDLIQAQQASSDWLEGEKSSVLDVARYFGCPADLIDAVVSAGTRITYANVTQRHLQFLITHLGPAIARREDALTQLTAAPRNVGLDTDALLRLDPSSRAAYLKTLIDGRMLAPSEARAMDGRPPFTQAQMNEFLTFWPPKAAPIGATPAIGQPGGAPGSGSDAIAGDTGTGSGDEPQA